jgi:hypothetical protein
MVMSLQRQSTRVDLRTIQASFVAACGVQLPSERSERTNVPLMHKTRRHLRVLAILAIPLLLLLHAPVLAALVPGALLTIASLDLEHERRSLPAATIVGDGDLLDRQRVAAATPVAAMSRRIG